MRTKAEERKEKESGGERLRDKRRERTLSNYGEGTDTTFIDACLCLLASVTLVYYLLNILEG